jgi:hypothetical protein
VTYSGNDAFFRARLGWHAIPGLISLTANRAVARASAQRVSAAVFPLGVGIGALLLGKTKWQLSQPEHLSKSPISPRVGAGSNLVWPSLSEPLHRQRQIQADVEPQLLPE